MEVVVLGQPQNPPVPIVQRHNVEWTPDGGAWERLQYELSKVDTISLALRSAHQADHRATVGVVRVDDFAIAQGELPSVRLLRDELGETSAIYLRENTDWTIEHGRSEITHRADEIVIAGSGTHEALSMERGRTSGLWVPFDRLTIRHSDLKPLFMRSIAVPNPLRRLMSTSAGELVRATTVDPVGVGHYLAGLADLVLRSMLGLDPDHAMTRQARREQIIEYILGRLSDSTLTVDEIAEAHYMSRTKLYQIFGDDGIASYIRRARLERAMRMLTDPLRARQTIGAISRQVGFTNQAHFTRLFTRQFGASPGDFRPGPSAR